MSQKTLVGKKVKKKKEKKKKHGAHPASGTNSTK